MAAYFFGRRLYFDGERDDDGNSIIERDLR